MSKQFYNLRSSLSAISKELDQQEKNMEFVIKRNFTLEEDNELLTIQNKKQEIRIYTLQERIARDKAVLEIRAKVIRELTHDKKTLLETIERMKTNSPLARKVRCVACDKVVGKAYIQTHFKTEKHALHAIHMNLDERFAYEEIL